MVAKTDIAVRPAHPYAGRATITICWKEETGAGAHAPAAAELLALAQALGRLAAQRECEQWAACHASDAVRGDKVEERTGVTAAE